MRLLPALAALLVMAAPVRAQTCDALRQTRTSWDAPLDRTITLRDARISVRAALDRVAAEAKVRFSYLTELVPTDRYICVQYDAAPAGLILTDILRGTTLVPVIAGKTHIVLTPARRVSAPAEAYAADAVVVLDAIKVAGVATRAAMQPAGANVTVIEGRDVAQHANVTDAINAHTGGVWAWESDGLTAQFGGMRGASSFGMNTPKIYIDGIEVANPLLLGHLDPASVDRIELVRGPQGSAMYGANAIGGVTNIVTRRAMGSADGDRVVMRSGFGIGSSLYSTGQTVAQDHAINTQLGSESRAANVNLAFGSTGEFVPGTYERRLSADGSGHIALARAAINGTVRVIARQLGTAASPLLPNGGAATANHPFTAAQYTAGVTATFAPSNRWTHAVTAGADGYALGGTYDGAFLSTADSALLAAGSAAVRGTLRLRSTADLAFGMITVSADHSMLHQDGGIIAQTSVIPRLATGNLEGGGSSAGIPGVTANSGNEAARLRSNSGLGAQLDASLGERVAISGGLRVDRGVMSDGFDQVALLPMLGGSYRVSTADLFAVTLRAAYGKAVRWPDIRAGYAQHGQQGGPALWQQRSAGPEVQAGIEAGIDVAVGRHGLVQLTRFDQTATGLTQLVEMHRKPNDVDAASVLRNVGDVSNRGWELQTSLNSGRLGLGAALSFVDSRVQQLVTGYDGDLRIGDRMLAIPARTVSVTSRWTETSWNGSITAYRASDWVNYDRIALAGETTDVEGADLRDYWIGYNGVTHMRASFARSLNERFTLTVSGDNLLDRQTGEPDNITVVPGRTFSIGMRARF